MDYQCPPCRSVASRLPGMLAPYAGKVRLTTRNLPLNQHPYAMQAAVTAEAAREQGKFEPVQNSLRVRELRPQEIESIVSENHLNQAQFRMACTGSAKARVTKDIDDAHKLGLHSTPSFVLCCPDGKVYQLFALQQISQIVK